MRVASHAQLYEDVILYRPLRHVRQGFYIDVGAHDPVVDSVTKLFYDRGWSGINIEPVGSWFDRLAANRTRDINLHLAAGAASGEAELFEIPESGLSTVISAHAERHRQAGWDCRTTRVKTRPLSEICREYVKSEIQFLKIDAEGAESLVLEGCDFARYRPWIVMIEATEPLTEIQAYGDSEAILLASGYEFGGSDGLNRYYLARERVDLQGPLAEGFRIANRRAQLRRAVNRLPLVRRIASYLPK